MKLLLIEDDIPIGTSLQRVLRSAGYNVVWLRHASDAKKFLASYSFDLLLLDIMLPGESGLDLLGWVRARGDATPVIMLTARDSINDRVAGLDGGADDYVPKPFAIEELLSRIRALLRRQCKQLTASWQVGPLSIDTARRKVAVDGVEIKLTAREYDILLALALDAGKVLTRAQIERSASLLEGADSNAIDVHIYNLRSKIGSHLIGTVRGVGYVLENA
ncbi:response regulator transcription factor [Pusillimonas caeni]|uniref:response regulator transcription factor n=1 Tax=Pusillimonas caeni TaxID=1348472 RepID=UPI000E599BE9|nr:response regulator transcription factor [Pusillimonas caeni]TFL14042.1 response regulator transcription factor [Pusillimonas caeni]